MPDRDANPAGEQDPSSPDAASLGAGRPTRPRGTSDAAGPPASEPSHAPAPADDDMEAEIAPGPLDEDDHDATALRIDPPTPGQLGVPLPEDDRQRLAEAPLNFQDAEFMRELFDAGARLMLHDPRRRGLVEHIDHGQVVMTGDLHDHGPNFQRICRIADLEASEDHHVIFHEVIHGSNLINGMDFSARMLARIAHMKLQRPGQVHVILSNHEMGQMTGTTLLKAGVSTTHAFLQGLRYLWGDEAERVYPAMLRYIRSMPLAIRTAGGVLCAHSLPAPARLNEFDVGILDRQAVDSDFFPGGHVYEMVWGRRHNDVLAGDLADDWGVRAFLLGHQPADEGFGFEGELILVLASDHEMGVALPFDARTSYDRDTLARQLVRLAAIEI